jgi:protein-arginine kinase activator protein McsA
MSLSAKVKKEKIEPLIKRRQELKLERGMYLEKAAHVRQKIRTLNEMIDRILTL